MSRQEAERIAAQVLMGWQDDAFSMSYEITDEQARKVVAALADAGLLADPADMGEYDECFFCGAHNADEPGAEVFHKPLCLYVRAVTAAGTPEEQTPDERQTQ